VSVYGTQQVVLFGDLIHWVSSIVIGKVIIGTNFSFIVMDLKIKASAIQYLYHTWFHCTSFLACNVSSVGEQNFLKMSDSRLISYGTIAV